MHDDIAVVQQNPLRGFIALHSNSTHSGMLHGFQNIVRNRAHMHVGGAAAYEKVVRHHCQTAQIQENHLPRLLVIRRLDDDANLLF